MEAIEDIISPPNPTPAIPSLLEITLDQIAAGFNKEIFTSIDLVRGYLKRIDEVDGTFKSILETNKDAVNEAGKLDKEAKVSGRRGPLHGIPILLKDNIVTSDQMEATAGSYALIGAKPLYEATIATRLRDAGAIILGKASLTEWANYRWNNAPTGWCPRGGQISGPFYPNMLAASSSTGSAVATSLGLAFAALGTETNASICSPAGKANLVGLKPTTGLVPRDGVIPCSNQFDTVGPLTRNVKDAATILKVIAGKTNRDPRTDDIPFDVIPDYTKACRGGSLSGIRIGIPRHCIPELQSDEATAFENAVRTLESLEAEVFDDIQLSTAEELASCSERDKLSVVVADFAESLGNYLATLQNNPQGILSLRHLLEYTKDTAKTKEDYPGRNVDVFELALDNEHYASETYRKLQSLLESVKTDGGIEGALEREGLDVLVAPTSIWNLITLASWAGSPLITVPLGFYSKETQVVKYSKGELITMAPGIPFPIYFFARRFEEEKLLKVAHAFEQAYFKGPTPKMYKSPQTDLEDIVREGKHKWLGALHEPSR
ncbi:glutamyl-tRNA amidotransferase subunit A [Nemania abortiva]|nr:glutamyl-tRNA amidotransferase subunit A [Nemania abortiva]